MDKPTDDTLAILDLTMDGMRKVGPINSPEAFCKEAEWIFEQRVLQASTMRRFV